MVPPKPVAKFPNGSSASIAKPKAEPAVTLLGGSPIKVNCAAAAGATTKTLVVAELRP